VGFKPNPSLALGAAVIVILAAAVALILDLQDSTRQSRDALSTGGVSAEYLTARVALADEQTARLERGAGHVAASRRADAALRPLPDSAELLRRHADHDFAALQRELGARSDAQSRAAAALGADAYRTQIGILRTGAVLVVFAMGIFGLLGLTVRRGRRRLDAARVAELARLEEMAITDALTGLRNHRAFHEDLSRELQRAGRQDLPLALALFDIDDFKALNSDEGHQAGDERLRAFTRALQATIRATDCAYRTGGDEFAVILPDCRAWGALELAQRLQRELDGFTATAGVAEAVGLRSREDLLREADQALLGSLNLNEQAEIYTLSLHDALPIYRGLQVQPAGAQQRLVGLAQQVLARARADRLGQIGRAHV